MQPKTLFHRSKGGALWSWTVYTKGPSIYTEYGLVDGKKQLAVKRAEAKNVGRSNATTPEKQAELEAESMYTNRLERKYSETPEEASNPVFLPMLAHDYEKAKKKIKYPVDTQPKLNGVRCLASWRGDSIWLMSRGGKDYEVTHLQRDIAAFLPDDMVLDGEIYLHGVSLQQVVKLVKKYRKGETEKLQLWVYDIFSADDVDRPWRERRTVLSKLHPSSKSIVQVQTFAVASETEVYLAQQRFVEQGFEGSIVRLPDGPYELGHRSNNLLKVKTSMDAEYPITGYETGVGKFEGSVIWHCVTPEGKDFKVVPRGTMEERQEWLREAATHVGKKLTVRYFGFTEDGIPAPCVGIGLREDEDT